MVVSGWSWSNLFILGFGGMDVFMEFVRVCAPMPDFEAKIQVGSVDYLMTDIIELHKTQIVGICSSAPHEEQMLRAFNFNQISVIQIPPKYEKAYLEVMHRVHNRILALSKGERNVLTAKPEAIYNAFYHVLRQGGLSVWDKK